MYRKSSLFLFTVIVCYTVNTDHVANTTICLTELDDSLWKVMNDEGSCEPYAGTTDDRISPCDSIFTVGVDYVYIPHSRLNGHQENLRRRVEEIGAAIAFLPEKCMIPVRNGVCHHLYLPCGNNGTFTVPTFVCPSACRYISETLCPAEWELARSVLKNQIHPDLRDDPGLQLPNCSEPDMLISFLNLSADCCDDVNIIVPSPSYITIRSTTTSSFIMIELSSSHQLRVPSGSNEEPPTTGSIVSTLVVSLISVAVIAMLLTIALTVFIYWRKYRKKRQLDTHQHAHVVDENENLHELKDNTMTTLLRMKKEEKPRISSFYFIELSNCIIEDSNIKLLDLIGQGEFGLVYHAVYNEPNTVPRAVAVKTLKGDFSKHKLKEIIEETLIMKDFDHYNVLSLIGVCFAVNNAPCIVMPYMSEGSLLSYLKRKRPKLSIATNASMEDEFVNNVTKQLLSICLQVANGMEYLTMKRFIHRDLAARNCMMSADGVIKVADFGLSEDIYMKNYFRFSKDSSSVGMEVKLPIKWMAPESIHDGLFSEKTDVWSYGVLCWEVFTLGKSPYPGMSSKEVVDWLDSGERMDPPKNLACTKDTFALITSCWHKDPDKRLTFVEIVAEMNRLIEPLADYLDFTNFFSQSKEQQNEILLDS